MMPPTERSTESRQAIAISRCSSAERAIELVRNAYASSTRRRVAVRLGVIRATRPVSFAAPWYYRRERQSVRVLVIAAAEKAREAEAAGADFVGARAHPEASRKDADFDVMVATPDHGTGWAVRPRASARGLMPNPKAGTVTFDVGRAVREVKAGKIEFRVDKAGNVHAPIVKSRSRMSISSRISAHSWTRSSPRAVRGEGRIYQTSRSPAPWGRRHRRQHPYR